MKSASVFAALALLFLSGCGFRPIYATPSDGTAPLNQLVSVRQVSAPQTIMPLITGALQERIVLQEGQTPKYDLYVNATERAERLAVQIDATVTRFNYRLSANYTLINLETRERTRGNAQVVTSYNIVTSQYSTLFAETTAQEKAARLLAEEIERDLLIRFSGETDDDNTQIEEFPIEIDPETDLLIERRREQPVFID